MLQDTLPDDIGSPPRPAANVPVTLIIGVLWMVLACGVPLYQVREARRLAHEDLRRIVTADKQDAEVLIAAFDRSNQSLDAAAAGPCLLLAFISLLLVNRMLKVRRRLNAPEHAYHDPDRR